MAYDNTGEPKAKENKTNKDSLKTDFKSTLKSMDTEEHIDLYFYRPIGYAWALFARRLGITPNAITIASIFLGVGAGICFYFNENASPWINYFWWNVIGVFLLIWADSFDSADGQLARMTGQYSRIGRILDGLSGDLWFFAIYIAICLRENMTSEFFMTRHWVIWVMAVITGLCHATQAAMGDYYRQFHLFFLKGQEGSELENTDDLRRKYKAMTWSRDFWQKLVMTFYINYTIGQENRTPRMQALRAAIRERFGTHIPQSFRDEFRALSLPLMKYTNILSFNVRTIALFIAILVFRMPWLYFAFELTVLNALLIYMMVRHERICTILTKQIKDTDHEY